MAGRKDSRKKPPRRRDAEATRTDLLRTATAVFAEKGFDGGRVDEVAAQSGVNKRMIYAYFGDKAGLYRAVLDAHFTHALALGPGEVMPPGPRAQAESVIRRWFGFLALHPDFVRLLQWEMLSTTVRADAPLLASAAAGLDALRGIVRRGVEEGEFRAGLDERKVVASVNALCLGFFNHRPLLEKLWRRDLHQARAQAAFLDHILALVFEGLSAGAQR